MVEPQRSRDGRDPRNTPDREYAAVVRFCAFHAEYEVRLSVGGPWYPVPVALSERRHEEAVPVVE